MIIVADENIPFARETFATLGQVRLAHGRKIDRRLLADADALLVRSITPVGADLLDDTPVRFVGTATIGTDHVDLDYLRRRHIAFSDAAGSNANSVVEYVLAAILTLARRHGWALQGKSLAIIGVGNIGSRLLKKAPALGLTVLPNDPPRQRSGHDLPFVDLDHALTADIITCHVPLTRTGPDATFHLLDAHRLARLQPHQLLINSSRGPVVDNPALLDALYTSRLRHAVLDVFENEPRPLPDLLRLCELVTPHIAGYSLDGKVNGTAQLYQALCRHLATEPTLDPVSLLGPPPVPHLDLDAADRTDQDLLADALTAVYPIERDDAALRPLADLPPDELATRFDHLRKTYPPRREARHTTITLNHPRPSLTQALTTLDFPLL